MNNTLFKIEHLKLNNFKDRVNSYKNYLDGLDIIDISDARLMAYEEATAIGCSSYYYSCPAYASNQSYWLGSESEYSYKLSVWSVFNSYQSLVNGSFGAFCGVRPVIVVKASDLPTNFD